jgi:hypothetical protein
VRTIKAFLPLALTSVAIPAQASAPSSQPSSQPTSDDGPPVQLAPLDGIAVGAEGQVGSSTADRVGAQGSSSFLLGSLWGRLGYHDLDQLTLTVTGAARPDPSGDGSYLRDGYGEVSASATGYAFTLPQPPDWSWEDTFGLFGLGLGYDQRRYGPDAESLNLDSGTTVQHLWHVGFNPLAIAGHNATGATGHLRLLDFDVTQQLPSKTALEEMDFLDLGSDTDDRRWEYDLAFGCFRGGRAGLTLGTSCEGEGRLELGRRVDGVLIAASYTREPYIVAADTIAVDSRATLRLSAPLANGVQLDGQAYVGRIHQFTPASIGWYTNGIEADARWPLAPGLTLGVYGEAGLSPYYGVAPVASVPTRAAWGCAGGLTLGYSWETPDAVPINMPPP